MSKEQKINKRKFEENNNPVYSNEKTSSLYKIQKTNHVYRDSNKRKLNCLSINENFSARNSKLCYHCQVHGDKDICDIYECSGINTIPKLNINTYYN